MPNPHLSWARDLLLRIGQYFLPLRQPSHRARNGEEHGEHLRLEAHRLIHDARIKIDIRIELAAYEIIVFQRDAFQLQSDFQPGVASRNFEDLVGGPLDDLRSRIVIFVDAMAEAHQLPFSFFDLLDVAGNVVFGTDLVQHVQYFFVGAAMQPERRTARATSSNVTGTARATTSTRGVITSRAVASRIDSRPLRICISCSETCADGWRPSLRA